MQSEQSTDQTSQSDKEGSIISDGNSVYSSASAILDSISSIFSIRGSTTSSVKGPPPVQSAERVSTASKASEASKPSHPIIRVDDRLMEYMKLQSFLKRNCPISTNLNVVRKFIREYTLIV